MIISAAKISPRARSGGYRLFMSSEFRVKIDKVAVSESDRKITVYCYFEPLDATQEEKDAFRDRLAKRSGFEELNVVFLEKAPAADDTLPPLPPEPPEDIDAAGETSESAGEIESETASVNESAADGQADPEETENEAETAEIKRSFPAKAVEVETVTVDFSAADYEKEIEALARADSQNHSYYGDGSSGGGYAQRSPGAGFYNGRGDGKRNKKTRITPPEGTEPPKDRNGNVILIGKDFDVPTVKMTDLTADSGYVGLEGRVFKYSNKKLSSGSYIALVPVTDGSYSVIAKFFFQAEDLEYVDNFFAKNKYIRLYGEATLDKFSHELTVMAKAIIAAKHEERMDNSEKKRVELHLHTLMSAVDAITRPGELMDTLIRWGWGACAITDHGVVQGYSEITSIYKDYKKKHPEHDFKFIYGCEAYLCHQTPDMSAEDAKKLPTYHCIDLKICTSS